MNKRNKENIKNKKHQLAQFFTQGVLIATCDLAYLDLNNIKIRRLPINKTSYLLESGEYYICLGN